MAFHLGHSRQRSFLTCSARRHHANLSAVRTSKPSCNKLISIEHEVRHLVVCNFRSKSKCLILADFGKFFSS